MEAMTIQDYISVGFFLLAVITTLASVIKGGPVDPLSIALKLVTDAEQMIEPKEGETWEQANNRKLRYVLEKMHEKYPSLDVALVTNLVERAVDLLKNRVKMPTYDARSLSATGSVGANTDATSRFGQF